MLLCYSNIYITFIGCTKYNKVLLYAVPTNQLYENQ